MISVEYKTDLGPDGAKDQGSVLLIKHNLLKENNKSSVTRQIKEENWDALTTTASLPVQWKWSGISATKNGDQLLMYNK